MSPAAKRYAVSLVLLCVGLALLLLVGLFQGGCTPAQRGALVRYADVSEPVLRAAYEAEQTACLSRPAPSDAACVTEVRRRWAPVLEAIRAMRAEYCAAEPTACQGGGG